MDYLQVAAHAGSAGGVSAQHAGGGITARSTRACLRHRTAVALLARLHETVPTRRGVEQTLRLVPTHGTTTYISKDRTMDTEASQ